MPVEQWTRYTCNRCNSRQDFPANSEEPGKNGWEVVGGKDGFVLCKTCFPPFQSFMSVGEGNDVVFIHHENEGSRAAGRFTNREEVLSFIGDVSPRHDVTIVNEKSEESGGPAKSVTVGAGRNPRRSEGN